MAKHNAAFSMTQNNANTYTDHDLKIRNLLLHWQSCVKLFSDTYK